MMPAGRIGHGDVRLPGKDERADMQQYLPLIIIVISMLATVGGMIFLLNAGRGLAGEALPGAGIR